MLPIGVMTGMMLGLEDLAVQLEDPFKFMPYGKLAGTTQLHGLFAKVTAETPSSLCEFLSQSHTMCVSEFVT